MRRRATVVLENALVEQIFPPLLIGSSDHPHDVAAGVQAEGSRFTLQAHVDLAEQMIPLAMVTWVAAGNQVFPC